MATHSTAIARSGDWRLLIIGTFLVGVTLAFSADIQANDEQATTFHSPSEYAYFTMLMDSLPRGYNGLFEGSGACVQCHGYDTLGIASRDPFGNDINLVDDWRASMMANSAKDPFWRAKVSHEVLLHPQYQSLIETKCTGCHAPLGHFAAFHQGADAYSIAEMTADPMALDGVSCLACHQQSAEGLGDGHSGDLNFVSERIAYGPFVSPLSSPMLNATQYEPVYSPHIRDAGVCAGCHTLITETIDLEGNLTGNTFVEQATYHEWLNSQYAADEVSCQSCHMPELTKGQFYLAGGINAPPRDRFYLHTLSGANVSMLKLMRDNADELGISATLLDFQEQIANTTDMLRLQTLDIQLTALDRTPDTAFIAVRLTNKAGHKFPSGYPSRRAFVSVVAVDALGDTIFHSGAMDDTFEVVGHDATYERHYATVRTPNEVQIYEQVLGDVNGDVTTVLTRADVALKDNRIPPRGFRTNHAVYDTTRISGNALTDSDFNRGEAGEGTGSDVVYYHIPTHGNARELSITATVYYQSIPPKWMAEMFGETTPEIEKFRRMFNAADKTPTLVATANATVAGIVSTGRTPTELAATIRWMGDQHIQATTPVDADMRVYNLAGQLLQRNRVAAGSTIIRLNARQQIVVVQLRAGRQTFSRQVWIP